MSRGGCRPNAGRKNRGAERFTFSIRPEYAERVKTVAKSRAITIGEALELMIDSF